MWPNKKGVEFYSLRRFLTMDEIKFAILDYFSIRATINMACERILHQYGIKIYT